jgi:transcriptional regulator with XRE-family HTH domain
VSVWDDVASRSSECLSGSQLTGTASGIPCGASDTYAVHVLSTAQGRFVVPRLTPYATKLSDHWHLPQLDELACEHLLDVATRLFTVTTINFDTYLEPLLKNSFLISRAWDAILPFREYDAPPARPEGRATHSHSAARRLRDLSGLDAARLASVFGVSRATYQHWISGAIPRGDRLDHVLQVLSLVEDAIQQLNQQANIAEWLRSPLSPTGRTPLDLLGERKYEAFRGYLLRSPREIQLLRSPLPPRRMGALSRPALIRAARSLSPQSWVDDYPEVAEKPRRKERKPRTG